MIKVRTYNKEHKEAGTIFCALVQIHSTTELSCCEVDHIEGEADITNYSHGNSFINVRIPLDTFINAEGV